jgi:hypothetical protein
MNSGTTPSAGQGQFLVQTDGVTIGEGDGHRDTVRFWTTKLSVSPPVAAVNTR